MFLKWPATKIAQWTRWLLVLNQKKNSKKEKTKKKKQKKNNNLFLWFLLINRWMHYENTPIQIYRKFHLQKLKIFRLKNSDIFHVFAQNIDCGYSLE